jgi:hypothetical protein
LLRERPEQRAHPAYYGPSEREIHDRKQEGAGVASCEGEKGWKEIQESHTQDIEDRGEIIVHGTPPSCGHKVFSFTSTAAWCVMTDWLL